MATSIEIKDLTGSPKGKLELNSEVFESQINLFTIRESLSQFLANQRQGTHATKTFSDVSGGGKKPWKQKGTGRARTSSMRNPLFRHGGTMHGPQPRDYSYKVNRKKKQSAIKGALSDHVKNNSMLILDSIKLDQPKSKSLVGILKSLDIPEYSLVLILTAETNENLFLAARNIPYVKVSVINNINIYDLLTCDFILATTDAIKKIEENLA